MRAILLDLSVNSATLWTEVVCALTMLVGRPARPVFLTTGGLAVMLDVSNVAVIQLVSRGDSLS